MRIHAQCATCHTSLKRVTDASRSSSDNVRHKYTSAKTSAHTLHLGLADAEIFVIHSTPRLSEASSPTAPSSNLTPCTSRPSGASSNSSRLWILALSLPPAAGLRPLRQCLALSALAPDVECHAWTSLAEFGVRVIESGFCSQEGGCDWTVGIHSEVERALSKGFLIAQKFSILPFGRFAITPPFSFCIYLPFVFHIPKIRTCYPQTPHCVICTLRSSRHYI